MSVLLWCCPFVIGSHVLMKRTQKRVTQTELEKISISSACSNRDVVTRVEPQACSYWDVERQIVAEEQSQGYNYWDVETRIVAEEQSQGCSYWDVERQIVAEVQSQGCSYWDVERQIIAEVQSQGCSYWDVVIWVCSWEAHKRRLVLSGEGLFLILHCMFLLLCFIATKIHDLWN